MTSSSGRSNSTSPAHPAAYPDQPVDLSADYIGGEPMPGDDADEAAWICAERLPDLQINKRTRALLYRLYQFGEAPDEESS